MDHTSGRAGSGEGGTGVERDYVLQPQRPPGTSIGVSQYCAMLVSREKLVRRDDVWSGTRGLYDPLADRWYWVDEREIEAELLPPAR